MIMAYFGDVSFSQVAGNSVSRGMSLGSQASRGSNMLSSFNRYSTGLRNITQPITRTSRDPLSVRSTVNLRSPMLGSTGLGGPRAGSRPRNTSLSGLLRPARNTGIIRPVRPTMFNNMMSQRPNMLMLGNLPRSRNFKVGLTIGRLRPIRSSSTTFTMKPQGLLRPDLQQRNSVGAGLLRSSASLAQQQAITRQIALTRNLLTSQKWKLSRNQTIFEIGRQKQTEMHTPKSIFGAR